MTSPGDDAPAVTPDAPTAPGEGAPASGPLLHGSFTLDVEVAAQPSDVYTAFERGEVRRRWLQLPGSPGPGALADLRPGLAETLRSQIRIGQTIEHVERRTQVLDMVRDRRIVLTYQALVDDRCRWLSLVTVQIAPRNPGTALTWTEQYALVDARPDGHDIAHLRGGTQLMLNGLAVALGVVPRPTSRR